MLRQYHASRSIIHKGGRKRRPKTKEKQKEKNKGGGAGVMYRAIWMAKQPFVEVLIRLLRVCVLHVPYAATGHVPYAAIGHALACC